LAEFTEQGFARASTNAIVKAAGIGKGMLFYYFGSKEELFDFLCEYAMESPVAFLRELHFDSGDFLERYMIMAEGKRRTLHSQPLIIRFFESLYRPENAAHLEKYGPRLQSLRQEMFDKLYTGLDYSLLRDNITPEKAIEYMKWLLERYEHDLTEQFKTGEMQEISPEALQGEWDRYYAFLADLRKIFYK